MLGPPLASPEKSRMGARSSGRTPVLPKSILEMDRQAPSSAQLTWGLHTCGCTHAHTHTHQVGRAQTARQGRDELSGLAQNISI